MTFCEMHKSSGGCEECPNRYVCNNSTLKTKIEQKHQADLAQGRMIWVRFPDSPMCRHLTMTEFEEAKKEFNRKAIEVQKETGADCVVYATKTYNDDGSIRTASLDIVPLDKEEYDRRVQNLGRDEMVYTVYKR